MLKAELEKRVRLLEIENEMLTKKLEAKDEELSKYTSKYYKKWSKIKTEEMGKALANILTFGELSYVAHYVIPDIKHLADMACSLNNLVIENNGSIPSDDDKLKN